MDVAWTIPALADLDQIQDFIGQDSPVAAFRFTFDLVRRTEALLSVDGTAGRRGRVAGTRGWVTRGAAYIVVYRIKVWVEVLAVIHAAREWPEGF